MAYIFISASKDDLDYARRVKTRLEQAGYNAWIDEHVLSSTSTRPASVLESLIRSAGAVVAIEAGDPDDIERAIRIDIPIFYLRRGDDPSILISQLKFTLSTSGSTHDVLLPMPKPLDGASLEALREERSRLRTLARAAQAVLIVAAVVVLALFLISRLSGRPLQRIIVTSDFTQEITPIFTTTPGATASLVPSLAALLSTVTALASPFETTATTPSTPVIDAPTRIPPTELPTFTPMPSETPAPTQTFTETLAPTPTQTPSITPSPTQTPTATAAVPAVDATLIPSGASESLWQPLEQQVNGVALVYVPGGCFTPRITPGGAVDGSLCVEPFWIGKTEVTNAQYAACVTDGACTPPTALHSRTRQSYYDNPLLGEFPVMNVTWSQARDFALWLGGSLPNETQWRYAAQGPLSNVYPWGDAAPSGDLLNYDALFGDVVRVGSFPAGASWVGALDMAGNVWEWTNTTSNQINQIVCGGSWNSYEGLVSASSRAENSPSESNAYTGFRVILDAASIR